MAAEIDFGNLLVVMALAAAIPLLLGLVPQLPLPDSVLEILAGIIVGPMVLAWIEPDAVIEVLTRLGVAFLLSSPGSRSTSGSSGADPSDSVSMRSSCRWPWAS